MEFEKWFKRLKTHAGEIGFSPEAVESMDPKAWKSYYDDGFEPEDAIAEDGE
jgi:hypothetical protein